MIGCETEQPPDVCTDLQNFPKRSDTDNINNNNNNNNNNNPLLLLVCNCSGIPFNEQNTTYYNYYKYCNYHNFYNNCLQIVNWPNKKGQLYTP